MNEPWVGTRHLPGVTAATRCQSRRAPLTSQDHPVREPLRDAAPGGAMTETLDHLSATLARAVVDDPEAGVFRANRRIFTDEELFELEMKHIFESNWIYLAHESQLPEPGDYFTTYMGRQPVVITRDKDGELHCLINACAHRGAMVCRRKTDNRTTLTCPFHGWTFRNDGTLLKVKDPEGAGYPDSFGTNGSHDMTRVAR